MTADIEQMVADLRVAGTPDRPVRHQAIVLLWAIGRARLGQPRLVRWSEARDELVELLRRFSLSGNRPTPEYPFVALAHTDWWELVGHSDPVPPAHGSRPGAWLTRTDPLGGLRTDLYDRLVKNDHERDRAVRALLDRFFPGQATDDVIAAVDL